VPEIVVNGDLESRWWGCLNVSFACVEGESLLMGAKNVAVSSGSACKSIWGLCLDESFLLTKTYRHICVVGAVVRVARSRCRRGACPHFDSIRNWKVWLFGLAVSSAFDKTNRFTTEREIDFAVETFEREVARLRQLSPLWEMMQEGIDLKTIQWTSSH
jgi:cysteine desulfurase